MRGLANDMKNVGLAFGVLALAGCATTGSVKRAQGAADSAMTAAQKAQSSADAAEGDAQSANAAAAKAQSAADAATQGEAADMGKTSARIDTLEHKVNYLMRHRHAKGRKRGHHHWHDGKRC